MRLRAGQADAGKAEGHKVSLTAQPQAVDLGEGVGGSASSSIASVISFPALRLQAFSSRKKKKRTRANLSSFKRHFNKSRCLAWLTLHSTAVPGCAMAAEIVPGSQKPRVQEGCSEDPRGRWMTCPLRPKRKPPHTRQAAPTQVLPEPLSPH